MKLINKLITALFVFGVFTQGAFADESATNAPKSQASCPERLDGFTNGEATAEQIKGCLGQPHHEDHNPDGRFVYLYNLKNKITITYLFESSGVLTRTNVYKKD